MNTYNLHRTAICHQCVAYQKHTRSPTCTSYRASTNVQCRSTPIWHRAISKGTAPPVQVMIKAQAKNSNHMRVGSRCHTNPHPWCHPCGVSNEHLKRRLNVRSKLEAQAPISEPMDRWYDIKYIHRPTNPAFAVSATARITCKRVPA